MRILRANDGEENGGKKGKLEWEAEPFATGATRWAFRGKAVGGDYLGFKEGTQLVVKVIKSEYYNTGIRMCKLDIRAQELARDLIGRFNSQNFVPKTVYARVGRLTKSKKDRKNPKGLINIVKGEVMLIERMIEGQYEKFNSNTGWSKSGFALPNFLSHWSYVVSKGNYLLCDLQGHRGSPDSKQINNSNMYYVLTDPVILSKRQGQFGCADLGPPGILKWFSRHECNDLCKKYHIADKLPNTTALLEKSAATGNNTTYVPTETFTAN